MRRLLLVLIAQAAAAPLAGQAGPALGSDGRVGGTLGAGMGFTVIRGSPVAAVRGLIALELLPWLRIGGEGVFPLNGVRTSPADSPDRTELRLGYGGVRVDVGPVRSAWGADWSAGLLVGAGTARVRSPAGSAEFGARNFFFVEPALHRRAATLGPFRIGGSASFRMPVAGGVLPGVRRSDLRGVSLSVTAELVHRR